MTYDIIEHVRILRKLLDSETSFVTITLLDIRGSAPQVAGAKAVVTQTGLETGTIGGGKIEATAIQHAQKLMSTGNGKDCELVTWNLQTDIGMTCGGEVKVFFEVHTRTAWPIAVFGAGHIAQSLIPLLLQLNCTVTCIDPRADWISKLPEHPKLKSHCVQTPREAVSKQPENAFFVLMSKGHATDLPVLAEILQTRDAPYIGVIGSSQKASLLKRELKSENISPEKIESFHCPMGLSIGNNTPSEIAISIVAQLIQRRDELGVLKHRVKQF